MSLEARLAALLLRDPACMALLEALAALDLADGWLAAGFVRNAVWASLHGEALSPFARDLDVIHFDSACADAAADACREARLRVLQPRGDWQVRNQARMHLPNGCAPYADCADAMRHWPETATAVGVRLGARAGLEVCAPYGLDDLFAGVLRPPPCADSALRAHFFRRLRERGWCERWPLLRVAA